MPAAAPARLLWDQGGLWPLMTLEACRGLGLAIQPISAAQVAAGGLKDAALLVVPGGWPERKQRALGPAGARAIADFLHGGGRYLGFCGGAGLALSVQDGLGLVPLGRVERQRRLPSLNGPVWVEPTAPGLAHPLWQGLPNPVSLPVWWPAQFADQCPPGVEVLASYGGPAPGFCSADLPLEELGPEGWPAWEKAYGLRLDPAGLAGQPAALLAQVGRGQALLTYLHLDTPGDMWGGRALVNLWQAWLGQAPGPPAPPPPAPQPQAAHLAAQAQGLWRQGEELGLWRPRLPVMPLWRRGSRGLEFWGLLRMCQALAQWAGPGDQALLARGALVLAPLWEQGGRVLAAQAARLAGQEPDAQARALELSWFPAPRRLAGSLQGAMAWLETALLGLACRA